MQECTGKQGFTKSQTQSGDSLFTRSLLSVILTYPIACMYGIFTYIWLICMANVAKYTIHGRYGYVSHLQISPQNRTQSSWRDPAWFWQTV